MIVEMRTYNIVPGQLAAVEDRVAEALPDRAALSPLVGFFRTEIGTLNQVIHLWSYESFEERSRIQGEAMKLPNWPPKIGAMIGELQSEIYTPTSFSPKLEPRALGEIYEIRTYTLKAGNMPWLLERWAAHIAPRLELSPLAFAGVSEFGPLNRFRHIWAYKDMAERSAVREAGRGFWPPPGGDPTRFLKQESMIVSPAAFSPLR
ncbi:MAG: NIPSNAP family protein [Phenylobacterium sp.]